MSIFDDLGIEVFLGLFAVLFVSFWVFFFVQVVQSYRRNRVLRYTDAARATELVGRVRQLKVRGYEEQAIQLVQNELAMPPELARSWVRSV